MYVEQSQFMHEGGAYVTIIINNIINKCDKRGIMSKKQLGHLMLKLLFIMHPVQH